jgi:hypothetical protein
MNWRACQGGKHFPRNQREMDDIFEQLRSSRAIGIRWFQTGEFRDD